MIHKCQEREAGEDRLVPDGGPSNRLRHLLLTKPIDSTRSEQHFHSSAGSEYHQGAFCRAKYSTGSLRFTVSGDDSYAKNTRSCSLFILRIIPGGSPAPLSSNFPRLMPKS